MATAEKPVGLMITQGRIALVLSIIALLSVGHQVSKFAIDLQNRTTRLEEKFDQSEQNQTELRKELSRLGTVLSDLNVTLREVQIRQEPRQ